jgi:uncharacterized protein (UPF0147 family)
MTEQEWLSEVEPLAMLAHLRGQVTDRKLLLFCCACCLQTAHAEDPVDFSRFMKTLEYADNLANVALLSEWDDPTLPSNPRRWASKFATWSQWREEPDALDPAIVVSTLRHIVGDPFHPPATLPQVSATVRDLAETVYQQNQSAVGPLHDALLDAGLSELAEHFRDPAEWHPKGCWALDLILGKS